MACTTRAITRIEGAEAGTDTSWLFVPVASVMVRLRVSMLCLYRVEVGVIHEIEWWKHDGGGRAQSVQPPSASFRCKDRCRCRNGRDTAEHPGARCQLAQRSDASTGT